MANFQMDLVAKRLQNLCNRLKLDVHVCIVGNLESEWKNMYT